MRRLLLAACAAALALPAGATPPPNPVPAPGLDGPGYDARLGPNGSANRTRALLRRIAAVDPKLKSIIAVNSDALAQAEASDRRWTGGGKLGPLDGATILVKDNIETLDPMATTAGSLALTSRLSHSPSASWSVTPPLRLVDERLWPPVDRAGRIWIAFETVPQSNDVVIQQLSREALGLQVSAKVRYVGAEAQEQRPRNEQRCAHDEQGPRDSHLPTRRRHDASPRSMRKSSVT